MGLFEHYRGDAGSTAEAGGKAKDQEKTYDALKSNLSSRGDAAASEVSGELDAQITEPASNPEADAGQAAAAALLAGGSINHFATAITTYNGHIDDLNAEYETEKAANFGVDADAGHKEGNTDAENNAAHDEVVAGKDSALKAKLEKKRQGFEDELDESADYAASLLMTGPNESTILSLYITGDITVEDASKALGISVGTLNNIRMATATVKGIIGFKDSLPALTQWLLKSSPKDLSASVLEGGFAKNLQALVRENARPGTTLTLADRLKAYKGVKADLIRGQALVKSATPGNLFGKYGANTKGIGTFSKVAGRVLSPLAIVAGGYGLYDTWKNRDNLPLDEEINGYVGSGATLVAGGLGTGMMIAAAAGLAFPPALAVVAIGAGVVALGSLAYTYKDEIWEGMKWTGDKIADGASALYDASGLDSVVDGVGEAIDNFEMPEIDLPDVDLPDVDVPFI